MRQSVAVCVAVVLLTAAIVPGVGAALAPETGVADGTTHGQSNSMLSQETPTCEFPIELEDGTGETVTIDAQPESVVALQPSDAQTIFEIGAEDALVGMPVGQYTDYLEADDDLDISEDDDVTPVTEEVIDRDPDVVLAANAIAGDDVIDQLRDAGLEVFVFPTEESLEGVAENVRLTGEITGECEGAEETIEEMDDRLAAIEEALEGEDRPLAYYEMGDGFTAGEGTFQDELLGAAGVENLGSTVGLEGWETVSDEVVLAEDPEWIIYGESFGDPPISEPIMGTTAYENEQVIAVNDQFMNQPGPLVVEAIEAIAEDVHGDALEGEDADATAADEAGPDDGDAETDDGAVGTNDGDAETDDGAVGTNDGDTETDDGAVGSDDGDAETDGESIPGFGAVAAIVGVIAALGLSVRR